MRCKISSHSLLCEGVRLEDEVFIGHGVMFTNDRRPQAATGGRLLTEGDWAVVSTVVHRGASIGSGLKCISNRAFSEGTKSPGVSLRLSVSCRFGFVQQTDLSIFPRFLRESGYISAEERASI
jgi:hypothetical protein